APALLADKAIHLSAVDIILRGRLAVRPAAVQVIRIVERFHALPAARIFDADRWLAILHRDAVSAGKRPEVRVERSVLLHDDDDMLDLLDAVGRSRGRSGGWRSRRRCRVILPAAARRERNREPENDQRSSE